ncbi:MAG TPA: DUF116 domain-containing protein [Methanoculleus sp.]|nr:DUF116 domain-containing protein [Methanoculleus sp.]
MSIEYLPTPTIPGAGFWEQLIFTIGEVTLIILAFFIIIPIVVLAISFLSIHHRRFYFPRLLKAGLTLTEGTVKALCKLFGLDDKELTAFFIHLHNTLSTTAFTAIPVENRAIFVPQCLRNSQCPANLTPEGLVCKRCGRCEVGKNIDVLESYGYKVWIAPGSTLIKRMVKKYQPEALIGVGCLMEVKEGIEMADKLGIVAMGVLTMKDGCVETMVNWPDVYDVACLGIKKSSSQ